MADRTPGTADWPETAPSSKDNAQVETQPLTVTAGAVNANDDAQARFVEQQWLDVENSDVAQVHPLSINRDSGNVTDDPYSS